MKHIKFGMVLGETGKKFSTRKGDTIELNDLMSKSIKLSQQVIEEKKYQKQINEACEKI